MWLFHLNRKQITLITLLASVESIIVRHPLELAELSKCKQRVSLKNVRQTQLLSDSHSRLALKAIVQVEVNDTLPTIARTSGACIALLDTGPKGRVK